MNRVLAPLVTALLVLSACSGPSERDSTSVVAGLYPFAYLARQVGGPDVRVTNLAPPGVEPHDLELTARQVAEVREADLVVHFTHLQPAVDAAIANPKSALDVDRAVPTIKTGNHDDAGDEPSADPHVWLDPIRMITIAKAIRDRLVAIDPQHAAEYRTNTSRLSAQLRRLDTEFRRGLNHCTRHTIVTSHAAFGYLSERYGLTQVPIAGIDPANEPSARQLASIAELVRREKITTIFTEELVSPAVANTVARETGVRTATLDPIEGLADSGQDYRSVMRANLAAIRKANDCT